MRLLVQRRDHGGLVDHALAREIEQHRARLHQRHALGVDQVAGRVQQRHMQGDEIAVLEHVFHLSAFFTCDGRLQAASTVIRDRSR